MYADTEHALALGSAVVLAVPLYTASAFGESTVVGALLVGFTSMEALTDGYVFWVFSWVCFGGWCTHTTVFWWQVHTHNCTHIGIIITATWCRLSRSSAQPCPPTSPLSSMSSCQASCTACPPSTRLAATALLPERPPPPSPPPPKRFRSCKWLRGTAPTPRASAAWRAQLGQHHRSWGWRCCGVDGDHRAMTARMRGTTMRRCCHVKLSH